MPLTPIDYEKTIIYKIQHKEKPDMFYIGHTTNFESRKYQHKKAVSGGNAKVYTMIRTHGGWDMFDMTPIKEFSCKSKMEACIEEQKHISELKATLNRNRAYNQEKPGYIEDIIERMNASYYKKQEKILKKQAASIQEAERRKLTYLQ